MKRKVKNRIKSATLGFIVSTTFTAIMASIMLASGIPIFVILPTSAPIWIGISNITYMLLSE
jgi:ABC-type bacteriocin/lantibiotic exporter with double-glycine peptidase domain